ncbi:MAG: PCP reductase family protein [Acidobacteriota bacterium]
MKFLCNQCNEQMKLVETAPDPRGSLSIVFGCPTCSYQVSMLTNPSETQLVSSLGVKIGKSPEASEGKCPFSEVVRDMGLAGSKTSEAPGWTSKAFARLQNIPEFVRPMAQQGIEHFAQSKGYSQIDEAVLDEAREQFGM